MKLTEIKSKCFFTLLILVSVWSCEKKNKNDETQVVGSQAVTLIIKHLPKTHNFNEDVYLSGDFEGWSGGSKRFKLKKENRHYSITIPKYKETISFKFTKGNWDKVECKANGNSIENRTYTFTKLKDTVYVSVASWSRVGKQNTPSTATKNVHVFADSFNIPQLNRKRKITIYLPPNYNATNKKYPVLYIQDGQNVFDASTSYSGEWEVDETLNNLYNKTAIGFIAVAINHGQEKRLNEYSAWDNKKYGKGEGALYLDFLVNTLKPEIDKNYRTKPENQNTAIVGASLGGLFAHYAAVNRPDVFAKAAIFSPSFWYAKQSFQFTKNTSILSTSKLYYLVGQKEDDVMITPLKEMVTLLKYKGVTQDKLFQRIAENGTHSETFWKTEFEMAIQWLFNIEKQ
ncbi:alpha/beta hydrolase-fold protein [Algibacter sp. PT7-4]